MSERMTDERLAEIEAFRINPFQPAETSAVFYELLQALKAERAEVARLEETVERQKQDWSGAMQAAQYWKDQHKRQLRGLK